jgi:hypothetical protein
MYIQIYDKFDCIGQTNWSIENYDFMNG